MPSRWLRIWANITVAGTIVLLALGAVVSSFKVGMADPIWPTTPWALASIDWHEPSTGFLIEHSHRLAGFTIGGIIAVLTLGLWWTETHRRVRYFGLLSLVGLLAAYGQLHGTLIQQTKVLAPGLPLSVSATTTGILVFALAAVLIAALATAYRHSPGWGLRLLAVALLLGVMVQGLLGGLRVHLNAILGEGLSVIHASFSQVVFGLAIVIALLCRRDSGQRAATLTPGTPTWSLIALIATYAQIVAGATLRHTTSPFGPRLHLLLAFVSTVAIVITCGRLWRGNEARGWITGTLSIVALQLILGVESWLVRFADGFVASEFRRITMDDAMLRTAHSLIGYLLFACTIVLAIAASRAKSTATAPLESGILEAVA